MYYAFSYILQSDVECYQDDLRGDDDLGFAEAVLGEGRATDIHTTFEGALKSALETILSEYNDMCDPEDEDEDSPVPLLLEDLELDLEVGQADSLTSIQVVKSDDEVIGYFIVYEVKVAQ